VRLSATPNDEIRRLLGDHSACESDRSARRSNSIDESRYHHEVFPGPNVARIASAPLGLPRFARAHVCSGLECPAGLEQRRGSKRFRFR
jgi:hypothetical protein